MHRPAKQKRHERGLICPETLCRRSKLCTVSSAVQRCSSPRGSATRGQEALVWTSFITADSVHLIHISECYNRETSKTRISSAARCVSVPEGLHNWGRKPTVGQAHHGCNPCSTQFGIYIQIWRDPVCARLKQILAGHQTLSDQQSKVGRKELTPCPRRRRGRGRSRRPPAGRRRGIPRGRRRGLLRSRRRRHLPRAVKLWITPLRPR